MSDMEVFFSFYQCLKPDWPANPKFFGSRVIVIQPGLSRVYLDQTKFNDIL